MTADLKKHQPYSKQDFERVLLSMSPFLRFDDSRLEHNYYKNDWVLEDKEWRKVDLDTKEYCYFLPLNDDCCIKVYSTVDRDTDISRAVDTDAIRVVAASTTDAKPVRSRFTRINRTDNWRINLKKRISDVLTSFGVNTKCPKCSKMLFLKRNSKDNSRFLGCSTYPGCEYKRNFKL